MLTFKLTGMAEMFKALTEENLINPNSIDKVVKDSTTLLVYRIKENYIKEGHKVTGNLVNSIQAFKRKRKGPNDPFYTYYVGPKYGKGGGNHSHFLEYGVYHSSYAIKGEGMSVRGRKYGKFSQKQGYRIKPTGVIRKSKDEKEQEVLKQMERDIVKTITYYAKKNGL